MQMGMGMKLIMYQPSRILWMGKSENTLFFAMMNPGDALRNTRLQLEVFELAPELVKMLQY